MNVCMNVSYECRWLYMNMLSALYGAEMPGMWLPATIKMYNGIAGRWLKITKQRRDPQTPRHLWLGLQVGRAAWQDCEDSKPSFWTPILIVTDKCWLMFVCSLFEWVWYVVVSLLSVKNRAESTSSEAHCKVCKSCRIRLPAANTRAPSRDEDLKVGAVPCFETETLWCHETWLEKSPHNGGFNGTHWTEDFPLPCLISFDYKRVHVCHACCWYFSRSDRKKVQRMLWASRQHIRTPCIGPCVAL